MLTNKDRVADVRDSMWQLEKDGQIVVHRITDAHEPVDAKTLYGWDQENPNQPALASQELRPVRQHPGLSRLAVVAA